MDDFRQIRRPVTRLVVGDRVAWGLDSYHVVTGIAPANDGSGHVIVRFANAPTSRYHPAAAVVVLELILRLVVAA